MDLVPQETRLIKRTFWLINHRWIAIGAVILFTILAKKVIKVEIQDVALYCVSGLLVIENLLALFILKKIIKRNPVNLNNSVKKVIHFQIFADLIALTVLLHYSGGIGNPFFTVYIFHLVIASILLSELETYVLTTFALLLFGLVVYLEYTGIIEHYCLCREGYTHQSLYQEGTYVFRTYSSFAITSFILVYLASSIGKRLRNQENSLSRAIEKLQKQDAIKNEYVLRVTHDIKGNLAAIQTNLAVLTNKIVGSLDEKQEEFLNRAYQRTIKLTNFVKNLLRLTNMRLKEEFDKEAFSINDVVIKSVNAVETNAIDKSIKLEYYIDDSVDNIIGNLLSIEEVITNLILNSIKYTPEKGDVTIRTQNLKNQVLVEIEDNGVGIPKEEHEKVFDEFFRGSNVKHIKEDSTGIGLSLVKTIINRNNGKIWIESEEGKGSIFRFTLPKNPPDNN
ncbi:MAG: hypothetical protein K8R86_12970 [Bacteroidales bacterium]|nr:hypothetical protein [Bacteroidales bacterium]